MEMEKEGIVTVLDEYDCTVMADKIRVIIDSPRDPSLADIMSELHQSAGRMYFDGNYYEYNGDYLISANDYGWYLDLFYA